SITRSYYRNSVGVIIVYDITNRLTFEHVGQWLKEAEQNVGGPQPNNCVFQLIGHKADLDDERQVMYEEGEYFAKYNKIKFLETSAVTGENVQESFKMIAREICDRIENGQLRVVDGWEGIRSDRNFSGHLKNLTKLCLSKGVECHYSLHFARFLSSRWTNSFG
ncbi:Ras-related protein, partial [Dirofilaria immitis]